VREARVQFALLLLSFACSSSSASAQSSQPTIEELVVTPNRIPVPLRQVGTSVTVLDAEAIEAYGNLSLQDVLRQLPALAASSNGGAGQPGSLRMRGEEGYRTLVIMDGMRLSDPSLPQIGPQVDQLLSSGIDRVEVQRGPQGLGYGADAGGILNISSRQAGKGWNGSFEAQTGSFDTHQLNANVGAGNERVDGFVSATGFTTGGFNSRTDDTVLRDRDGYNNTTLHARAGVNLTDHLRAELVHREVSGDTDFDGCYLSDFSYTHACHSTYDQSASRASLTYHDTGVSHAVSYAITDTDRASFAGGVAAFAATGKLQRWEYLGSVQAVPGLNLVFGADYERAGQEAKFRGNQGYFAEALIRFSDAWYVTAGARFDDNDDFGSNTSYRFTTAYLVPLPSANQLKFKASIGTGFRAPSPYEIAYNSGAWSYPPASLVKLQQESSKGAEAGVEYWPASGLKLEAVYFDQQVDNAIEFDLANYSGYLQDPGRSTSRGVELSAALPLSRAWSWQANYTWNDTARPDGAQRLRRPRQLINAGLQWQPQPRWLLHAFVRSSRDAIDQTFTDVVPLDNFAVLDVGGNYQLTHTLQLFARIENALDAQYQEVIGYRTPGQAIYVGFRLTPGTH